MKIFLPVTEVLKLRLLELTKLRELVELVLLSTLSFLIPVLLSHPQLLVGIVVNALIVRSALTMKRWKNLPTILLPVLGVLTRGALFGPSTVYLIYLAPFIWLGNFVLAFFTKLFSRSRSWAVISIVASSTLKAFAIFLPVMILIKVGVLPEVFQKPMGITQLITAIVGSAIAFGITRLEIAFGSTQGR